MKKSFLFIILIFIFSACSQKQYFQAEQTTTIKKEIISTPSYIKSITANGATLDDNRYLDKNGISKDKLKDGFHFLNNSNNVIILANKHGDVLVNEKKLHFKFNVIAAALENNLLALIFTNNTIAVYDLDTKTFKFKKYLQITNLHDTRISMPLFASSLIIFPSLNGQLLLVNKKTFNIEKTFNIDPGSEVNNIILLSMIHNNLVVASQNVLMTLSSNKIYKKDFFIQSFALSEDHVFIATLDGRIIKLDKQLNVIKSKKYKFAKFQALSFSNGYLYAIESQGYLLKLSDNFEKEKIDKISFEDDEKTFAIDNKIYYENKLISF